MIVTRRFRHASSRGYTSRLLIGTAALLFLPSLAWGGPGDRSPWRVDRSEAHGQVVPLSDAQLAGLRGGHVERCDRGARKRVILWDEARSAELPLGLPRGEGNRISASPGIAVQPTVVGR
jgi:hypothetical protein